MDDYDWKETREIFEHLGVLLLSAQKKASMSHKGFENEDYEWRIGFKVLQKIGEDLRPVCDYEPYKNFTAIYGIRCRIDYNNPERIELWQNITNVV